MSSGSTPKIINSVFNSNNLNQNDTDNIINILNSLDLFKNNPIPNKNPSNKKNLINPLISQRPNMFYLNDKGASGDNNIN